MPRSPEYVKAKPYERFRINQEALWRKPDLGERGKREKPGKIKPGEGALPGPSSRTFRVPDKGEPPRAVEARRPGKDVSPRGRQFVEYGTPRMEQNPSQWAHAERIRPTAIEGRPAIGPAPERRAHSGPDRTPLTGGRQFELGPGHEPVTAADRRAANLAAVVANTPRQPIPPRERNERGMSIITGEIVPERSSTREIKSVGPASRDAHTTPIDKIRPARSGDTGALSRTEYTHDKTAELPKQSGLQRAQHVAYEIGKLGGGANIAAAKAAGRATPLNGRQIHALPARPQERIALTQHAEPLGQMSLFPGPERVNNEYEAKTARTERQSTVPPSLAAGRQVEQWANRQSLRKKPGSQGTLFQPARYKV